MWTRESINHPFLAAAMLLICLSCGETATPETPREKNRNAAPRESTDPTQIKSVSSPAPTRNKVTIKESNFAFRVQASGGRCHGIFVTTSHFIAPKHCFQEAGLGRNVELEVEGTAGFATIEAILKAPSFEVEEMVLLKALGDRLHSTNPVDPRAFDLPEKILPPFPLELRSASSNSLVCTPLRYNTGGLVAYDCPTMGSMSGAVLTAKDSTPFAIHLGRKSGLGYAIVLGSIKNDILGALANSKPPTTEGRP